MRDEEAESLRKARSRQARQTRRSTQVRDGNGCEGLLREEAGLVLLSEGLV